jgi:chemotaxis protein histidine kinase CheA
MAMKRSIGILAIAVLTTAAWAQNPDAIDNVRSTMKAVQQKQTADSNAALGISAQTTTPDNPAKTTAVPSQTAPAKSTTAKPATAPAAKAATAQATKPATATPAKTAASAKPAAPATGQAKSAAPAKAAATTSANKTTTTKTTTTKTTSVTTTTTKTPAAQMPAMQASLPMKVVAMPHDPMKPPVAQAKTIHKRPVIAAKPEPKTAVSPFAQPQPKASDAAAANPDAIKAGDASKAPKPDDKKWAMNGKRDPFFSPVVQQPTGSGCSTGKKCLEIGQINLRGVVHSDGGFIAVVTNNLNKAYFLRENDPVFNGYVVKITGDSVVFQETVQDKLGKPLTREVVKRLFTPAV